MSFGTRLKARREQLGITQPQLAEMLGVSKGAIGNYETDANSPKATILFKVFDVLKCDANYLFQDEMKELTAEDSATPDEMENLVKKYRALDKHGREMVDFTLQKEWERSTSPSCIVEYTPTLKAAHNDYTDEPGELDKMLTDINNLKRP